MTSDAISAAYEAPYAAARAWKSGGGQVVGYLSNTEPVELIEAAGIEYRYAVGLADLGL